MSNSKDFKQMTIPIFIPHLGCGHSCTFCNQRTISGTEREPDWSEAQVRALIDEWLMGADQFDRVEIGFFGGSFTGIPSELQEKYLAIAKEYKDLGRIQGIRLSTRPDYLGDEVIIRLLKYGVTLVEIGVQSYSDEVLSAVKRGHDRKCIQHTIARLQAANLPYGIQLMIGLPKDTKLSWMETVKQTIADQPTCVRIYPTLVLSETELATFYLAGDYQPIDLEMAVDQATDAYLAFREAGIPVIRMGLQSSEGLSEEGSVLAGPHHDAFRSLVETEIYKRMIERDLASGLIGKKQIVRVNPKHVSFISGYKRSNIKWLETSGIQIVKIEGDPKITPYQIEWIQELKEAEVE